MEKFSALLALCVGNSAVIGFCDLWSALMASVICTGTNGWVNNRDAGDLRRHSVHYDVTVMQVVASQGWFTIPSIIPRHIVIMRIIFCDGNDIWYLCEKCDNGCAARMQSWLIRNTYYAKNTSLRTEQIQINAINKNKCNETPHVLVSDLLRINMVNDGICWSNWSRWSATKRTILS